VSLSLTLNKNDKVEPYIRNKTHELNVLRFLFKGNEHGLALISFL